MCLNINAIHQVIDYLQKAVDKGCPDCGGELYVDFDDMCHSCADSLYDDLVIEGIPEKDLNVLLGKDEEAFKRFFEGTQASSVQLLNAWKRLRDRGTIFTH